MIILILLLTLLNFLIIIGFTKKIGTNGSEYLSSILLFLSCILSWINLFLIINNSSSGKLIIYKWYFLGELNFEFSFFNDNLSAPMLVVVLSISSLVHYYSRFYMKGDPHLTRFLSYLSLFTFLMLILVTSSNLILLFIGWEGVGLCSYLLVSFWYSRNSAIKSALKAILVNRFGDIGFIIGSILILLYIGSLDFSDINTFYSFELSECFLIPFFLIIAVMGKSAQFGLHSWLPDAMEGPTPVSALIHAATMVTAGIFLIIRCSIIFHSNYYSLIFLLLLGSLTSVFAASIGLLQNDFKKVIAYSTCSQLGYMALICGLGEFSLSLFHLFNHAFFKALLFLSAGSIIHSLLDEQDFRKGGILIKTNPISIISIIIGSLALMGLPFLTGFYSKDLIIELSYSSSIISISYWLGILAASFTSFYSLRLILAGLINQRKLSWISEKLLVEGDVKLNLNMIILSFMSIFIGFLSSELFKIESIPIINSLSKQLPLIFSIFGSITCLMLYLIKLNFFNFITFKEKKIILSMNNYARSAWSYDMVIHHYFSKWIALMGDFFYHKIDRQFLEMVGPWRLKENINAWTTIYIKNHSSIVFNYILYLYFFLIAFNIT